MALPKRWEPYSAVGKRVEGTRFISFKVPLNEKLCSRLPKNMSFSPDQLVEQLEERGEKLAVVIDLTNTYRYYNKEEFLKHGIKHEKILVEGKRIPSKKVVNSFFVAVEKALAETENKDSLIGVHCTHGVNRTGYLVCRYMIEKMLMDADKAIEAFSSARGHPIERENFLQDLKLRENGGPGLPEDDKTFSDNRTKEFNNRFSKKQEGSNEKGDRFHDRGGRFHDSGGRFHERDGRFHDSGGRFHERGGRFHERGGRFHDRGRRFYRAESGFPEYESPYEPELESYGWHRHDRRFDGRDDRFYPGYQIPQQNFHYDRERDQSYDDWSRHRPHRRGGYSGRVRFTPYDRPGRYGAQDTWHPPHNHQRPDYGEGSRYYHFDEQSAQSVGYVSFETNYDQPKPNSDGTSNGEKE